ncbi:hypothetical protein ACLB2K_003618 [Fragaria x ananassa]
MVICCGGFGKTNEALRNITNECVQSKVGCVESHLLGFRESERSFYLDSRLSSGMNGRSTWSRRQAVEPALGTKVQIQAGRSQLMTAEAETESNLKVVPYAHLKDATRNFSSGVGGSMFKGWVKEEKTLAPSPVGTGIAVAVKRFTRGSEEDDEKWETELRLEKPPHENLVKLLGYCDEKKKKKKSFLLYEFVPNGSLPNHLFKSQLSMKSDVYSFGVVLLQILTGLTACDYSQPQERLSLVDWAIPLLSHKTKLQTISDADKHLYISQEATETAKLAQKCLNRYPQERPSMEEVVTNLELIRTNRTTRQ